MKIKGYHVTATEAVNSDGQSSSNILDFLITDTKGYIGILYHLDYSVANIMRYLNANEFQIKTLLETTEVYIEPWVIRYVSKKFLNIQKGAGRGTPFTNLSDAYQYHHNADLTELDPDEYAKIACELGNTAYDMLCKLGLNPKSLVSPVREYEKEVLSTLDLPRITDIPKQAGEYAYKCCQGSWVEAYQKGHWEQTWDYDIKSAYGAKTAELLDLRYGEWVQSNDYIEDAYYCYCKCWVNIDKPFSPIQYGKAADLQFTPTDGWETHLNKAKIDLFEPYELGTCEILDGWWWIPGGQELVYPLQAMIEDLHEIKEKTEDKLQRGVVKRIIAGIWGKFIEQRGDGLGALWMPPWAAEVESGTQVEVAKFVLDNDLFPDYLLHIAVDGVFSSKLVNLANTGNMGDWKLSHQGAGFVISSGVCAIQGKEGEGDFALSYEWLRNQIQTNPNEQIYQMSKLTPITLWEAINNKKMDKLGRHTMITKNIDVIYELKRDYPVAPMNGEQLYKNKYQSYPWSVGVVEGLIDNQPGEDKW